MSLQPSLGVLQLRGSRDAPLVVPFREPNLGDAIIVNACRLKGPLEALRYCLAGRPWCPILAVVDQPADPNLIVRVIRVLPKATIWLSGPYAQAPSHLTQAIRSREKPSVPEVMRYLERRGIARPARLAIEDALTQPGDKRAALPTGSRSTLNRRLARYGPLRTREWSAVFGMLRTDDERDAGKLEQIAWAMGRDPRTLRSWATRLLGHSLHSAIRTPGWEWKLETVLRRFRYVGRHERGSHEQHASNQSGNARVVATSGIS